MRPPWPTATAARIPRRYARCWKRWRASGDDEISSSSFRDPPKARARNLSTAIEILHGVHGFRISASRLSDRRRLPIQKIHHGGFRHHRFDGAVASREVAFRRGAKLRLQVSAEVAGTLDDAPADADPL